MIQVREVLRVIGGDEPTRSTIMLRFKTAGASLDRWQRRDREAMADAITRAEDALELMVDRASRRELRMRLRAIRRRLEDELDGYAGQNSATIPWGPEGPSYGRRELPAEVS